MSIHKSFKRNKWEQVKSVRKRYERVAKLIRNLEWMKKNQSVYNLPKEKIIRLVFKIKKEKKVTTIVPLYSPPEEEKKKKTSRDVGKIK